MLQCVFVPTLTLLQSSEQQTCLDVEYRSENGICCNKCFPGNVWPNSQSRVHWQCHTSYYTNCKTSFSEVKFYSDPPHTFVFQVIGLQRSALLWVREPNAPPVSADNTEIQRTTLPPAEDAKAAKVQYSDLYPTKSDSSVRFAVAERQSSESLCSFLFPQHQRTR